MRELLSYALELVGWSLTTVALGFLGPWLVVVWVGLTLMVVGYVIGDE